MTPPNLAARRDAVDEAVLEEHPARQRMLNAAWAVYERRADVSYSQTRPSQLLSRVLPLRTAARAISRADCSGLVALACHRARIRPGIDWRYTNTWTQLATFPREVSREHAEPGDLVFYGPARGNPTHVAILLRDGRVLSNGHHPMGVYAIDYRLDRIHIRSLVP